MELLKPPHDTILISGRNTNTTEHTSTMTDTTKVTEAAMRKKVRTTAVVTGIVTLIIGFGLGALVFRDGKFAGNTVVRVTDQTTPTSTTNSNGSAGSSQPLGTNGTDNNSALALGSALSAPSVAAITVSDQKPGTTVLVSLVSTDAMSWLALRENNNGLFGNILGAKRLDVGTTGNVEIPLLRSTQAGKSYSVVLFKDNGDKVFDFKTDAPMTADGMLISKTFTVK